MITVLTYVLTATHGTFMANAWDFYKPALSSEFPEVDGPLTLITYLGTLETVYDTYRKKVAARQQRSGSSSSSKPVSLDSFDYVAFHGPYGKLVQKGYARLVWRLQHIW